MKDYVELKNETIKIIKDGWLPGVYNSNSSVGVTFEKALGKDMDEFEIPDYKGIEIKTKTSTRSSYITMFSATPDSYLFEARRIYNQYGYPDRNNPKYKMFNVSLDATCMHPLSNKYRLILRVDYEKKIVHLLVYNTSNILIDNLTSWSFEMLEEKLNRKFQFLLIVFASRKIYNNKVYFKYTNAEFYKLKSFQDFLYAVEKGFVRITFKLNYYKYGKKEGQLHDHGTSFDLNYAYINELFEIIDAF